MKRFTLGLTLLTLLIGWAAAQGSQQCHAQPQHVQQVAVVPVASVAIPVYAAVYAPPQQANQNNDDLTQLLADLIAEVRALRADVQALRNPTQALAVSNVLPTVRTACAKCHSATSADKDGGGFTLLDARGELAQLSDRDKARVVNRVSRNSMPPAPSKLGAKEKAEIVKAFEKGK